MDITLTAPAPPEDARTTAAVIHLPHPPVVLPRLNDGHSQERARQAAERAVAAAAIDSATVEASTDFLPYEAERAAQAGVELAGLPVERIESEATGVVLLDDARQGRHGVPSPDALTRSVPGLTDEYARAARIRDQARSQNDRDRAVLDGTEKHPDGTLRPGTHIAPDATDLVRAMRWATAAAVLPLLLPALVEGAAVTANMRSYLRVDDADLVLPVAIAVIAVGVLTVVPYLVGRALDDVVHGARLHVVHVVGAAVAVVAWVTVGVVLALVRVDVDRAEAIAKAEEQRQSRIQALQGMGTGADVPLVDPDAVFDPTLPTVLWVAVFLGFGALLILWEMTMRNPARVAELRSRRALLAAEDRVLRLADALSGLEGSVAVQAQVNVLALRMWDAQADIVSAACARDVAVHDRALAEASHDPSMPLAIEQHRASHAARATAGGR